MKISFIMLATIKFLLNLNPSKQNLDLSFSEEKRATSFDCNWILGHVPSSKFQKVT